MGLSHLDLDAELPPSGFASWVARNFYRLSDDAQRDHLAGQARAARGKSLVEQEEVRH